MTCSFGTSFTVDFNFFKPAHRSIGPSLLNSRIDVLRVGDDELLHPFGPTSVRHLAELLEDFADFAWHGKMKPT